MMIQRKSQYLACVDQTQSHWPSTGSPPYPGLYPLKESARMRQRRFTLILVQTVLCFYEYQREYFLTQSLS